MSRIDGIIHCKRLYWDTGLGQYIICQNVVKKSGDKCESCFISIKYSLQRKPRWDKDGYRPHYEFQSQFPWVHNERFGTNLYLDITL